MNKYIVFLLIIIGFASCDEKSTDSIPDRGYFEFVYKYVLTTNGVSTNKTAYKRINLQSGTYAFYKTNTLADSLKSHGLRTIEITLSSETTVKDSAERKNGYSYIQIQIADTLATDKTPDRLLTYSYYTSDMAGLAVVKTPLCTGMKMNINLNYNSETNKAEYSNNFIGELKRKVYIYSFGGGIYQITANGSSNSVPYNLNYIGLITRAKDIE